MTFDNIPFVQICRFFEELQCITSSTVAKRTNASSDNNSSYYLTKDTRRKIYESMTKWFKTLLFEGEGSIMKLFRLLVPEVINQDLQLILRILFRKILEEYII